ncbi:hypothetical protein KIN20_008982 [Parelaphostrongylus tenuis]|uniref:Uncharacterized protein n=1 Tax=Parelaphostrongylus tenuis TaxID=148309 RepID=A0AAD5M5K4_PARTN|nr:hypothetical protein KIN20_008982 [Parelaphostrongylus tenuis]
MCSLWDRGPISSASLITSGATLDGLLHLCISYPQCANVKHNTLKVRDGEEYPNWNLEIQKRRSQTADVGAENEKELETAKGGRAGPYKLPVRVADFMSPPVPNWLDGYEKGKLMKRQPLI